MKSEGFVKPNVLDERSHYYQVSRVEYVDSYYPRPWCWPTNHTIALQM
jgi:hypothetical protein